MCCLRLIFTGLRKGSQLRRFVTIFPHNCLFSVSKYFIEIPSCLLNKQEESGSVYGYKNLNQKRGAILRRQILTQGFLPLIIVLIMFAGDDLSEPIQERIKQIQGISMNMKNQILQRVQDFSKNLKRNRKYTVHEQILKNRMEITSNCIRQICDTFFTMIMDEEYIMLTPLQNINDSFEKLSKNVNNSLQKILQNLDDQPKNQHQLMVEEDKESDNEGSQEKEADEKKKKSKNYKISIEASEMMQDWLLRNFENPYPSLQEKKQMAKHGNISMIKVNNWFINARQRTVKNYFNGKERK